MNEDPLKNIIEKLDSLQGDDPARSRLQFGSPAGFDLVTANRAGLISLARTCLRAATASIDNEEGKARPEFLEETHEQVQECPDDSYVGLIQRAEDLTSPLMPTDAQPTQARKRDRAALLGCSVVGFILIFLLVSGVMLWGAILTGNPRWLP